MSLPDPLRVTAIEPSGKLYGSEFCLLDILRGTSERGLRWDVVLPAGGGFDDLLRAEGVPARTLLPPALHERPRIGKLWSYWRVRQHLVRRAPDVLYVNQAGMLRAVNALTRGLDIPMVCQVQTLEDALFIGRHPEEHATVKAFVFNSRFTASHVSVAPEKRCVFYQGVETGPVPPPPGPPAPGEPWKVGILGRIAMSKGHYVLLDAARALVAERGRRDLRFVVIGEGITPQDTRTFEEAVAQAGLADVFEFRGYRRDVKAELARLHLLVIPSPAEPLGRVLLDACAAGVPALVSEGGGLGEFSRDLGISTTVPAGDSQAWAMAIAAYVDAYDVEAAHFHTSAAGLLRRLAPEPYLDAVAEVIRRAAGGEPTAATWFGEPA